MIRSMKRIICFLCLGFLILFLSFTGTKAFAVESGATVSLSGDSAATVGDEFVITLRVSSEEAVNGLETYLRYPADLAKFVDADTGIAGGDGILKVSLLDSDEGETSNSYSIRFKARNPGKFTIKFSDEVHIYSYATGDELSVATSVATVQIKNARLAGDDTSLARIRVAGKTLNPSFSKDIFDYSLTVENDVTSLVITAEPSDDSANVSVSGNKNFEEGINDVTITVTAENGGEAKYVIHVVRMPKDSTKTDSEIENKEEDIKIFSEAASKEAIKGDGASESETTYQSVLERKEPTTESGISSDIDNDNGLLINQNSQKLVQRVIMVLTIIIVGLLIVSMIYFSKSRKE